MFNSRWWEKDHVADNVKGPFTLSVSINININININVSINIATSLAILLIKLLDFFKEPGESLQKWLQPQLIRYDARIDAGAPTKSLTLTVNGP